MFGDLMGDMQEKQKAMKEKLASITVDAEAGNGAVKITANANKEILNISIDQDVLETGELEELEDLLLIAINEVLAKAMEKEQVETQKMLKDMLPPGMGGLGNLFG